MLENLLTACTTLLAALLGAYSVVHWTAKREKERREEAAQTTKRNVANALLGEVFSQANQCVRNFRRALAFSAGSGQYGDDLAKFETVSPALYRVLARDMCHHLEPARVGAVIAFYGSVERAEFLLREMTVPTGERVGPAKFGELAKRYSTTCYTAVSALRELESVAEFEKRRDDDKMMAELLAELDEYARFNVPKHGDPDNSPMAA